MLSKEHIKDILIAEGKEIAPDDPADRTPGRRVSNTDGVQVYYSAEEETATDAQVLADEEIRLNYEANHKYKNDRRRAYGNIGDQLDMIYWDQVNDTTTFKDYIASVKAAHAKP